MYDTQLVHLLVWDTQWIFKMHGATIQKNAIPYRLFSYRIMKQMNWLTDPHTLGQWMRFFTLDIIRMF